MAGDEHEEAYAGVELTYCRVPLARSPEALRNADAVVVGAPFDLGTSYRPGARFGPRAIRNAEDVGLPSNRPHMELGIDPFAELSVVDFGDCPVGPTIEVCHAGLFESVSAVLGAQSVPFVLGGDHSLSLPVMRALAQQFGSDGYAVIHFDTHADTELYKRDETTEHATPFYRAVHEGHLRGGNLLQVGLRGAWPHPAEFDWMRREGIRWHTMSDIEEDGLPSVVTRALVNLGDKPLYLTVDIDVLDPAFGPGTGTPEPGGLTTRELLGAVRRIARSVNLCAMDIVEVSPPYDPSGITALAAHRVVLEALSGLALRRTGREAQPQRPA